MMADALRSQEPVILLRSYFFGMHLCVDISDWQKKCLYTYRPFRYLLGHCASLSMKCELGAFADGETEWPIYDVSAARRPILHLGRLPGLMWPMKSPRYPKTEPSSEMMISRCVGCRTVDRTPAVGPELSLVTCRSFTCALSTRLSGRVFPCPVHLPTTYPSIEPLPFSLPPSFSLLSHHQSSCPSPLPPPHLRTTGRCLSSATPRLEDTVLSQ